MTTDAPASSATSSTSATRLDPAKATAEAARQRSEERELRLLIEHLEPVCVGLYDAESQRLLHASAGYLELLSRLFGIERERILGRRWPELAIPSEGSGEELFRGVVEESESRRVSEVRVDGADGRRRVLDCALTPILDPPGERPRYVIFTGSDVTDPVRMREELARIDHLKDEFLSLASHELRTPLVPLTTYSELLERLVRESGDADPRIAEYVGKFKRQLHHLARLIDDLTDVARLESGRLRLETAPVDVGRVAARAIETIDVVDGSVQPELRAEAGLVVLGDGERLQQAIANLVGNAVRHGGGKVEVVSRRASPRVARVEVSDTGRGIQPELQDRVFTRFFQAESRSRLARTGMGLGLFIARGIVEQHGGKIGLHSTPGQGTTFWIELPLATAPEPRYEIR